MVIWLIGLSGSGKSTIARELYSIWKEKDKNTVYLDGDIIRGIFRHEGPADYSLAERKRNADRISELCLMLDKQNINVVCAILSAFESSREWNRTHYSKYFEAYINVPIEILRKRDIKGLYESALQGRKNDVVGVDLPFEEPKHPDFIFENHADRIEFASVAKEILERAQLK